jgi:hypothetical protein
LLEVAGMDTVPELAQRNVEKKRVRQVPAKSIVEDWVAQANKLDRVLTHRSSWLRSLFQKGVAYPILNAASFCGSALNGTGPPNGSPVIQRGKE